MIVQSSKKVIEKSHLQKKIQKNIQINSTIQLGKKLNSFLDSEIKYEPMFFSSSYSFAHINSGKPTKEFLNNLPDEWKNDKTIIDSRVHMLMKGWYPCIPGYHHDDVPRERSDRQPEYFNPSYRSKHAMILYNGSVCPTDFAVGTSEFFDIPVGETYYKKWHPIVCEKIKKGEFIKISAPENQIIFFDDRTFHQGTSAEKNGWRLFIRASKDTKRPILNEIRKQVQVYLEKPMEGW